MSDVISVAEDREPDVGLAGSEGGRRSSSPPMIVRERGAGFCWGEYWGRRGAAVMRLVRTLISRFGWMMVILILKGAIS